MCGQQAVRGYHHAFPLDSLGLDQIQAEAFAGQPTRHYLAPVTCLFVGMLMRLEPRPYGHAFMPGGIVPHQQEGMLASAPVCHNTGLGTGVVTALMGWSIAKRSQSCSAVQAGSGSRRS